MVDKWYVKLADMKNCIFIVLICFVSFSGCESPDGMPQRIALDGYFDPDTQSYAFVIPNLKPVSGVAGLSAKDCAVCHQTIYKEWQNSTHASALRDIQFHSEITKPDSPKWLCLNCHTPLQNQRERIITHLQDNDVFKPVSVANPHYDPALEQEAITCATCHIRKDEESGESYIIGPNGSGNSPHPVRQDRSFLRNMCQRCHNPQGEGLTPNLICWFYTTDELAEGQPHLREKFDREFDCVDCHMPEKQRLVADIYTNLPEQQVNQHHWTGSGIPKWFEGYDSLLSRGYKSGLDVAFDFKKSTEDSLPLTVLLTNARSGHYLPSGDPERFLLAVASLYDNAGKLIAQDKYRIGQDWIWNPARKMGDNRLKQGETRHWRPAISTNNNDIKTVEIIVLHVRLNTNTAKYIIAAENVDEKLFANGQHYVSNAIDYYPFASFIYKATINLNSRQATVASSEELIELSKLEKGKSLDERLY